jgi:hypothetical protein
VDAQADETTIPVGAPVIAANGEELGRVHTVHAHYFLVERGTGAATIDLEVPSGAVALIEGSRVVLRVNREALSEVPNEHQAAAHRLRDE